MNKNKFVILIIIIITYNFGALYSQNLILPFSNDVYEISGLGTPYNEIDYSEVKSAQLVVSRIYKNDNWELNVILNKAGKRTTLIQELINIIEQGEIFIYDDDYLYNNTDKSLNLTFSQFQENLGGRYINGLNQAEDMNESNIIFVQPDLAEIKSFIIAEIWLYDYSNKIIQKRLVGIIPIRHFYKELDLDEENETFKKTATFYYPEIRKYLDTLYVFNNETNQFDLTVNSYFTHGHFRNDSVENIINLPSSLYKESSQTLKYPTINSSKVYRITYRDKIIDLNEIENYCLYLPTQPANNQISLIDLLIERIKKEKVIAYSDETLSKALSPDEILEKLGAKTVQQEVVNNQGIWQLIDISIPPNTSEVKYYKIRELCFWDEKDSILQSRVHSLMPIREYYREEWDDGITPHYIELFTINYNECRKYLAQKEVVKNSFDEESRTFDDVFFNNDYTSIIVGENNIDKIIGMELISDTIKKLNQKDLYTKNYSKVNKTVGVLDLINKYLNLLSISDLKTQNILLHNIDLLFDNLVLHSSTKENQSNYINVRQYNTIFETFYKQNRHKRLKKYYYTLHKKYKNLDQIDDIYMFAEIASKAQIINNKPELAIKIISEIINDIKNEFVEAEVASILALAYMYNDNPEKAQKEIDNYQYAKNTLIKLDGTEYDLIFINKSFIENLIEIEKKGNIHKDRYRFFNLRETFDKRLELNFPFLITDFENEPKTENLAYYAKNFSEYDDKEQNIFGYYNYKSKRIDTLRKIEYLKLASQIYDLIIDKEPNEQNKKEKTEICKKLSDWYLDFKQEDKAITVLTNALEKNPDLANYKMHKKIAEQYLKIGDTIQAKVYISKEININPDKNTIKEAFSFDKSFYDYPLKDNPKRMRGFIHAHLLMDHKISYLKAEKIAKRLHKIENTQENRNLLAEVLTSEAWYLLKSKQYQKSLLKIEEARILNPKNITTIRYKAPILLYNNRYQEAKQLYTRFKDVNTIDIKFKEIFVEDLEELNKLGLKSDYYDQILSLLTAKYEKITTENKNAVLQSQNPYQIYRNIYIRNSISESEFVVIDTLYEKYPNFLKFRNIQWDAARFDKNTYKLVSKYPAFTQNIYNEHNYLDSTKTNKKFKFWLSNLEDTGFNNTEFDTEHIYIFLSDYFQLEYEQMQMKYPQNDTDFVKRIQKEQTPDELVENALYYLSYSYNDEEEHKNNKIRAKQLVEKLVQNTNLDIDIKTMLPDLCERTGVELDILTICDNNTENIKECIASFIEMAEFSDYSQLKIRYRNYAEPFYAKLIELEPTTKNKNAAVKNKTEIAYNMVLLKNKNAEKLLNKAMALNPNEKTIYAVRPFAQILNNKMDDAKNCIKQYYLRELEPDYSYSNYYLDFIDYCMRKDAFIKEYTELEKYIIELLITNE